MLLELQPSHDSSGNKLATAQWLKEAIHDQTAVRLQLKFWLSQKKQITHTGFGLSLQLQFIAFYNLEKLKSLSYEAHKFVTVLAL